MTREVPELEKASSILRTLLLLNFAFKIAGQPVLIIIFIPNAYYTSVRKTGYDKTKQPIDAGKSQETLSVGVLAYLYVVCG